jgi:hypothetical protein
MTHHRWAWLLAVLPWAGVFAAEEPKWLTEARAREGRLIEAIDIRSPDGLLTARVPAKLAAPIQKDDDEYVLQFDVGTDTPVNCEVLLNGFDSASLLRASSELTLKEVEKAQGKIEQSGLEGLDAGVYGPNPYLAASWLYRVAAKDGARLGAIKQVAVDMHAHGVYCAHIDLGYVQTFRTIVRSLAETLQLKGSPALPRYLDISTVKLGPTPVGFAVTDVMEDEDGDSRARQHTSLLMPGAGGTVNAVESVQVEWSEPKGSLLNAALVSMRNGETEDDLKLALNDDSKWHASGTFQGKQLEAVVGDAAPASTLAVTRKRREVMAGKDAVGFESTQRVWTSLDPTRLVEMRFKITGRAAQGAYSAQEGIGPVTMEYVLDPTTGTASSATLPIGPQVLHLERVYVQGVP